MQSSSVYRKASLGRARVVRADAEMRPFLIKVRSPIASSTSEEASSHMAAPPASRRRPFHGVDRRRTSAAASPFSPLSMVPPSPALSSELIVATTLIVFFTLLIMYLLDRRTKRRLHIIVLAPGGDAATRALTSTPEHIYLASDQRYDQRGMRYPAGWASMQGVALVDHEEHGPDGVPPSPGGQRASGKNLATWASVLLDVDAMTLRCADLTRSLRGSGSTLDELLFSSSSVDDNADASAAPLARHTRHHPLTKLDCLVCGSRGGQVTLLALWARGLRLPAVVINGGCARAKVAWMWPAGVPVVLLTCGRDFFNEHKLKLDGDKVYVHELWASVPPASKAHTAIVHLPLSEHHLADEVLRTLLPACVRYAASGLDASAKPTAQGLPIDEPLLLVTHECPDGVWLQAPLAEPPSSSHDHHDHHRRSSSTVLAGASSDGAANGVIPTAPLAVGWERLRMRHHGVRAFDMRDEGEPSAWAAAAAQCVMQSRCFGKFVNVCLQCTSRAVADSRL